MRVLKLHGPTASVQLSKDELLLLNNALNEICHGIDLRSEFSMRIGCEEKEAAQLLQQINGLLGDMSGH